MKLKKQFSGVLAATTVLLCSALSPFASASAATTNILLGDANGDGVVNVADTAFMSQYLGGGFATTAKNFTAMDINEDGVIDLTDQDMLSYYEANPNAPTKANTVVNKTCYNPPLNTDVQYRRHDCSSTDPKTFKTYTIPINNIVGSSANIPEYSSVYGASVGRDTEHNACVEIFSNGKSIGSGFVVSNDTIATSASCLYNKDSGFINNVTVKMYIFEKNATSPKEEYTASAEYLHIPTGYTMKNGSKDYNANYDYGLIRIGGFKDNSGKTVNVRKYFASLGIMTDEFINAEKDFITAIGYYYDNSPFTRRNSTGIVAPCADGFAYRYSIKDGTPDLKGGMTNFDSSYTNPSNKYTINTSSTVGINSESSSSGTYGVRITPNIIRFLNMSSLFEEE